MSRLFVQRRLELHVKVSGRCGLLYDHKQNNASNISLIQYQNIA